MSVPSRRRKRKSQEFLSRSADLFLREAPARVEELWVAGKARQMGRVAVAAHTLACLAENLDADQLQGLAVAAERAAGGDELSVAQLPEILYGLEIAYTEVRAGLERKLGIALA
jgi:hypothetical protein